MYSIKLTKPIFYTIALMTLLLAWKPVHVSAATASMTLTPSAATVTQGQNFTVLVKEDSSTDTVNGVQVSLTFPVSKLTYVSTTYATSNFEIHTGESNGSGFVKFSVGTTTPVTGNQDVGTVTFKAVGTGTVNIGYGCDLADGNCSDGNAVVRSTDSANILASKTATSVYVNSTNSVVSDQTIPAGQAITSANVLYTLIMQSDGNLVLYGNNMRPMWFSGTGGSGANRAVMQADGNLVLYRSNNTPVWWTGTGGNANSTMYVQDDGNVVLYSSAPAPKWWTGTGGRPSPTAFGSNTLASTQQLDANKYLKATDGRSAVLLQSDGNLVLYGGGYRVLWSSGGAGANRAVMQSDGNLVLYRSNNTPTWWSGTGGVGASSAVLQRDGNFVIYTNAGSVPKWWTGTSVN